MSSKYPGKQYLSEVEVKTLCQPLFHDTGIRYFDHTYYYGNHTIVLSSDLNWYHQHSSGHCSPLNNPKTFTENSYVFFWKPNRMANSYCLCLTKREKNAIEMSRFLMDNHRKNVVEYYFNNSRALEKFIAYFRQNLKPMSQAIDRKALNPSSKVTINKALREGTYQEFFDQRSLSKLAESLR